MAGLPWIPLDVGFPKGPKAIALGVALQDKRAWAHVVLIWTEAAQHAADGHVNGPAAVQVLEEWACWNGSPGALVDAMCLPHIRLLDQTEKGFYVHDWHQHCGAHVEKREKDRKRMRRVRTANRSRTVREQSRPVREQNANSPGEREKEREKEKKLEAGAVAPPSRLTALTEAMAASFAEARGGKYLHGGAKDATALKRLLPAATDAEILRRWRLALRAEGYHRCDSIAQFSMAEHWNHFASGTQAPMRLAPLGRPGGN